MTLFFGLFLIAVSILLVFFSGVVYGTGDSDGIGIALLSTLITIMGVLLFWLELEEKYYKQGQIDAINGKVEYKLETQPDSSRAWVKKDEGE